MWLWTVGLLMLLVAILATWAGRSFYADYREQKDKEHQRARFEASMREASESSKRIQAEVEAKKEEEKRQEALDRQREQERQQAEDEHKIEEMRRAQAKQEQQEQLERERVQEQERQMSLAKEQEAKLKAADEAVTRDQGAIKSYIRIHFPRFRGERWFAPLKAKDKNRQEGHMYRYLGYVTNNDLDGQRLPRSVYAFVVDGLVVNAKAMIGGYDRQTVATVLDPYPVEEP
jgi:hypothetical protein